MSQNPFEPGQPERSEREQAEFLDAIAALPEVFFTADAVLHIEGEWPELECEKTCQEVTWAAKHCEKDGKHMKTLRWAGRKWPR